MKRFLLVASPSIKDKRIFLRKSQFAAEQGWSRSYVTKLKDQKRLVLSADGKLVDVAATLEKLQSTNDPGKESVRQHHASGRAYKYAGSLVQPDTQTGEKVSDNINSDPTYWENKSRREIALAKLAELELAKRNGELVDRASVEAMSFATGRMTRDAIFGLLPSLASELALLKDTFQIEAKMREAVREVFIDLSKITADDLAKALESS